MIDWYKKVVFENYANFNGRARRSEYWYFALANIIIGVILMILDNVLGLKIGSSETGILNTVYSLAVLVPGLAVATRRLHDIGKSGWILVITYIIIIISATTLIVNSLYVLAGVAGGEPAFGLTTMIIPILVMLAVSIYMLVLFCKDGERGENQYGQNPKEIVEM